jgi:glycine/D-amino acid oxidase-like deaminating enzyme
MTRPLTPDLCIIGAGSGGLSVAAGAAQMGAEIVLIERELMGGDCLKFHAAQHSAGHSLHPGTCRLRRGNGQRSEGHRRDRAE